MLIAAHYPVHSGAVGPWRWCAGSKPIGKGERLYHSMLAGLLLGPVPGKVDGGQQDVIIRDDRLPVLALGLVTAPHDVRVGQPCLQSTCKAYPVNSACQWTGWVQNVMTHDTVGNLDNIDYRM